MKMKKGITMAVVIICCVVFAGTALKVIADSNSGVIRDNVRIENMDVSGLSLEQANEKINTIVEQRKATEVKIKIDDKTAKVTLGELGYEWTNTEVAKDALGIGRRGNIIRRYMDELDVSKNGINYQIETTISQATIESVLESLCKKYNVEPQNASIELTSDGFQVISGQTGVVVDYEATASDIYTYVTEQWDKSSDITVEAKAQVKEPEHTEEEFNLISDIPMGSYTTTFTTGDANRNGNIKNGAELLDGHVLFPEESFSLNGVLAPWTEEHGWFPAGTYVDGAVSNSLGGGICQVSSTLYNALLLAEIEIVDRFPHSMSVGYVPLAADAALAGDYKDLVFKNNTNAPIYIQAIYTEGSITFKVFGYDERPDNRTIEYVSETISTTPIETEVEEDESLPEDYEETVSNGHTGYVAKLWKYVYVDGVETEKVLVNTSTYRMTPTKVIKGTKKEEESTSEGETTKKKANKKPSKQEETTTAAIEEPTEEPTASVSEEVQTTE